MAELSYKHSRQSISAKTVTKRRRATGLTAECVSKGIQEVRRLLNTFRQWALGAMFVAGAATAAAQMPSEHHHDQDRPAMTGMDHSAMGHGDMDTAGMFLMNESSGTASQPVSWPMPMTMTRAGNWRLMWMREAFIVDTQQSGPRGGDKFFSSNWGMLGAIHRLGGGSIMLRSMISLEPATITDRRYPLLFQTGETAYGVPLVDAQHPHDFVMELSIQYARPIGEKGTWNIYCAPVGDPALGPVAYPPAQAPWSCRRQRSATTGRILLISRTTC
jgi:hypothetical protein